MSTPSTTRRTSVQRFGIAGIGTAVLFVGIASPASAATDVVIPLDPTEVVLSAVPVENFGAFDPMADPAAGPVLTPVGVQYSGTITVDLPAELDSTAVAVELGFDDNGDGTPDVIYTSTAAPADPDYLLVTGQGTSTITVTLPADDSVGVDEASLILEPLALDPAAGLGPAFTYYDPVYYDLAFDASALAAVTVAPELVALSQVPCPISSTARCAFPTAVTAGSTVTVDLTAGSVLRELGLTDLTGVAFGLAALDASGTQLGAATPLASQVTGSTASFVLPADAAAGQYGLVVAQVTPSGAVSVVLVELTVEAAVVAAPSPQAAPVNAGLRSNTGVTSAVPEGGSAGTATVAAGAGLLLLAGAGGVAATRTRRRPAAGTGSSEA